MYKKYNKRKFKISYLVGIAPPPACPHGEGVPALPPIRIGLGHPVRVRPPVALQRVGRVQDLPRRDDAAAAGGVNHVLAPRGRGDDHQVHEAEDHARCHAGVCMCACVCAMNRWRCRRLIKVRGRGRRGGFSWRVCAGCKGRRRRKSFFNGWRV